MEDSYSQFEDDANNLTEDRGMSTFLHNVQTLGGFWGSRIQKFHRNLHVIRDSFVHRESISLKDTSMRGSSASHKQRLPGRTVSDDSRNPTKEVCQTMLVDGSESTIDSDDDALLLSGGDEMNRSVTFPSASKEPPSFWETRLETFAANIDTLSELVHGGGTLMIRIEQEEEKDLAEDLHLTI